MPSTLTSAASGRNFLRCKGHSHGGQDPRLTTRPGNSACSGSSGLSIDSCKDNEEALHLLDLWPYLLGVATQAAELLLREVPRAASPFGVQTARQVEIGPESPGPEVVGNTAGKWFASFCVEDGQPVPPVETGPAIGMDVGVGILAVCSNGLQVENPQALNAAIRRLRQVDKARSREVFGRSNHSNRRERLYAERRKVHARIVRVRIVRVRNDNHHKATTVTAKCVCSSTSGREASPDPPCNQGRAIPARELRRPAGRCAT